LIIHLRHSTFLVFLLFLLQCACLSICWQILQISCYRLRCANVTWLQKLMASNPLPDWVRLPTDTPWESNASFHDLTVLHRISWISFKRIQSCSLSQTLQHCPLL
jgi:hypothetical protein